MTLKLTLAALAATFCTTSLSAHDFSVGEISIMHPYIPESAGMARTAGGYMEITNTGDTDDRLIGVRSEAVPTTMLHETVMSGDIAQMRHMEAVALPAGETVMFQRGGKHVMFMGLDGTPLVDGDTIDATLMFETAGEVEVVFNVEAPKTDGEDGNMEHSDMDHSDMDHGTMSN